MHIRNKAVPMVDRAEVEEAGPAGNVTCGGRPGAGEARLYPGTFGQGGAPEEGARKTRCRKAGVGKGSGRARWGHRQQRQVRGSC